MSSHSDDGCITYFDEPAYVSFAESLAGLPVRNTFIHFNTPVKEAIRVPVSNSLPHNMKMKFSQLLASEAASVASHQPPGRSNGSDLKEKAPLILADHLP